ncbi:Ecto-ADP-ribosyltransferase 5 [Lemmus lemmus]
MEELAGLLLEEEMARHALLRESWEAAQEAWAHRRHMLTLPPGFKAQHGIAIMVYTNSSNTLYWELNQAALSVFPEEREVLIPPHEVFLVTGFFQDGAQSIVTLWSYNQTCSHFNCAYLGGERCMGDRMAGAVGQPELSSTEALALQSRKMLLLAPGELQLLSAGP